MGLRKDLLHNVRSRLGMHTENGDTKLQGKVGQVQISIADQRRNFGQSDWEEVTGSLVASIFAHDIIQSSKGRLFELSVVLYA